VLLPGGGGGVFLDEGEGRVLAYAFPTGEQGQAPAPPLADPPHLEAGLIRDQARWSLGQQPGQPRVTTQDVGPSRVVVATEPVGRRRPARLVAWALFRLTGPEQTAGRARLSSVSAALALGGMVLALALAVNLGLTLRRQRREQERLREELRRSEHLAALGKLLAGVAHEVRNPLAGIRSTVQLWQRLPEAARTPASMEALVAAVDRLNEIVTRLLHFSRAEQTERQPVDVNKALDETLRLLQAQAAAQGVSLERDLAPKLPPVSGSAGALRQVFLNLALNALQAMPHGGRLVCRTRYDARGRQAEVRLSDTGPGVSAADRQHLFEPFFTTRPGGTGLGLALCREIVLGHGGRIDLEPGQGPGATFRVLLPAQAP
jgi:two-component system sensor histidine kinase HydH